MRDIPIKNAPWAAKSVLQGSVPAKKRGQLQVLPCSGWARWQWTRLWWRWFRESGARWQPRSGRSSMAVPPTFGPVSPWGGRLARQVRRACFTSLHRFILKISRRLTFYWRSLVLKLYHFRESKIFFPLSRLSFFWSSFIYRFRFLFKMTCSRSSLFLARTPSLKSGYLSLYFLFKGLSSSMNFILSRSKGAIF